MWVCEQLSIHVRMRACGFVVISGYGSKWVGGRVDIHVRMRGHVVIRVWSNVQSLVHKLLKQCVADCHRHGNMWQRGKQEQRSFK